MLDLNKLKLNLTIKKKNWSDIENLIQKRVSLLNKSNTNSFINDKNIQVISLINLEIDFILMYFESLIV